MVRSLKFVVVIFAASSVLAIAENAAAPAKLSAAEIVDRSVTAQGGAQAWRAIDTMTMAGKMEAGGNNRPGVAIPGAKGISSSDLCPIRGSGVTPCSVMDLKRPKSNV